MTGAKNIKWGLALLAFGLAGGLAMSLYAFRPIVAPPPSLDRYDDLPRRLLRLAHIAAIMLPLLNIAIGSWLDRLRLSMTAKRLSSALLLFGAIGLPATLALEACWTPAQSLHVSGVPAVAFCLGIFVTSWGALRTPLRYFTGTVVSPDVLKGPVSKTNVAFSSPASFFSPGDHSPAPPPPHP